jgi:hypothetical protein
MRWASRLQLADDWRPWFAWYPVTLPRGVTVWLETVMRRGTYHFDGLGYTREWHYSDAPQAGTEGERE